jgi:hypothetical protein
MEAQGLSQGSLRNSHRETHAVKRKRAPASFQELGRKLLESCSQDTVIRQRLDPERAEAPLKRGTFFVLENEGRADPGYLIFLPGKPAIFYQFRRRGQNTFPDVSTLRMRVSAFISEGGGSVFVATLDDVMHTLRLEDVWMWRGKGMMLTDTYTKRRELLKEFVQYHWVPDARLLGGIYTSVAQPMSMEQFAAKKTWDNCHSVEFIPDMPGTGKRRMVWFLEAQVRAAEAHAGLKQDRVVAVVKPQQQQPQKPQQQKPAELVQRARATPVDKMPDVYDLYGEDGALIHRASVQQFRLSLALRHAAEKGVAWVRAEWRPEFSGYEITDLL